MKIADIRIGNPATSNERSLASLLRAEAPAARPGKRIYIDPDKTEDFYAMEMPQRSRQTQPRRNHGRF